MKYVTLDQSLKNDAKFVSRYALFSQARSHILAASSHILAASYNYGLDNTPVFYIIDVSELYGRVLTARSSLIDLLTTALMGDKLAAEYTLLNLISTV